VAVLFDAHQVEPSASGHSCADTVFPGRAVERRLLCGTAPGARRSAGGRDRGLVGPGGLAAHPGRRRALLDARWVVAPSVVLSETTAQGSQREDLLANVADWTARLRTRWTSWPPRCSRLSGRAPMGECCPAGVLATTVGGRKGAASCRRCASWSAMVCWPDEWAPRPARGRHRGQHRGQHRHGAEGMAPGTEPASDGGRR